MNALTADETSELLSLLNRPLYADFLTKEPVQVWVVEHALFAPHRALAIEPMEGYKDLVWALVEASVVGKSRGGFSVTFWKGGATGWFPHGNVRLPKGDA